MSFSFELNNARNDATYASGKVTASSPVVEIFSALSQGKDLSKYGAKADAAVKYIRELAEKAETGDVRSMSELNEIRKFVIQPQLLEEIRLLGVFGSYQALGWNETPYLVYPKYENLRAEIQAEGLDVPTPFVRSTKKAIAPVTISAGWKANYRELALGNFYNEGELQEEVRKTIRNKAAMYVLTEVFTAIENATGVKYFYENSTLAKASVDALLLKIRKYGKPNVIAPYAVLAQFLPWIGYAGEINGNTITGVSQRLIDQIADTGIVGTYNGAVLSEIPAGINYEEIDTTKNDYKTLLPEGLGIVVPIGGVASPVQTFTIGGLTTMTGNNVTTGDIMTRFDLAVAAGVARTDTIGIIHDSSLDTL